MNPYQVRRWLRRILFPLIVLGVGYLLVTLRFETAPLGQLLYTDRLEEGALVVLHRRPNELRPDALVFFATADGTACAEVARVVTQPDGSEIVHLEGTAATAFPDGVPRPVVLGVVLTTFGGARAE
ncbi:MAG: hypothetical protein AB7I19_02385 [Planctomycetota bacterium]